MPDLLVVMPARNSAATIRAAVQSTLAAMPKDSALGVWSDGSTDATIDELDRIRDPRLRVWGSDDARGSGRARQSILERVDSAFVANMDSDDVTLPWRFRHQRRLLQRADLVFGSVLKFRSALNVKPSLPLSLAPQDAAMSLLMTNLLIHSTLMARRNAIESADGYRDLRFAEDYDLWLRAASRGYRIRQSSLPITCYRVREDQNSRQPGYLPRLRGEPELKSSYLELLEKLTSGSLFGLSPSPISVPDPAENPQPLKTWLESNLRYATPAFALRYRFQLRPLGVSWRQPEWSWRTF